MSRRYRILRQASIGSEFANVDAALAALAPQQPGLADVLRKVDWVAVRAEVARGAIAQVAQQRGIALRDAGAMAGWQTEGGAAPEGECVGVIAVDGGIDVALFINADRIELAWSEEHYARDAQRATAERAANRAGVPPAVERLQEEISAALRERAMDARLRIGGRVVTREQLPGGAVKLVGVKIGGGR